MNQAGFDVVLFVFQMIIIKTNVCVPFNFKLVALIFNFNYSNIVVTMRLMKFNKTKQQTLSVTTFAPLKTG